MVEILCKSKFCHLPILVEASLFFVEYLLMDYSKTLQFAGAPAIVYIYSLYRFLNTTLRLTKRFSCFTLPGHSRRAPPSPPTREPPRKLTSTSFNPDEKYFVMLEKKLVKNKLMCAKARIMRNLDKEKSTDHKK